MSFAATSRRPEQAPEFEWEYQLWEADPQEDLIRGERDGDQPVARGGDYGVKPSTEGRARIRIEHALLDRHPSPLRLRVTRGGGIGRVSTPPNTGIFGYDYAFHSAVKSSAKGIQVYNDINDLDQQNLDDSGIVASSSMEKSPSGVPAYGPTSQSLVLVWTVSTIATAVACFGDYRGHITQMEQN